jgi:hypothetical protein
MTPKEKAKELLYNYELQVRFSMEDCSFTYRDSNYGLAIKRTAKQCALIAVDEMLDFRNGLYINEGSLAHQWLLDVKQEIEKL